MKLSPGSAQQEDIIWNYSNIILFEMWNIPEGAKNQLYCLNIYGTVDLQFVFKTISNRNNLDQNSFLGYYPKLDKWT